MVARPTSGASVAPGLVLAAPSSGSGKTTVTMGLMAAFTAAGREVAGFKVGPDYIDPGFHAVASGRPGRNLDVTLVGEHRIRRLYARGAAGRDVGIVEGVMGLFDGHVDDEAPLAWVPAVGSTAHVAGLIGAPVVLVVDVRGYSQSLAALISGFATHDPGTRIAGVLLNNVRSERHVAIATAACESAGVPVLGAVPRTDGLEMPSRHLGLVTAGERGAEAADVVARAGQVVADSVDLDRLAELASTDVGASESWDPAAEIAAASGPEAPREGTAATDTAEGSAATEPVTIALASGPAFSFSYTEQAELLEAAGARVVRFDPLVDRLPAGAGGVILPGGFPEEHAASLAANEGLRSDLRDACAAGMPVHAECAGLLYLCRELTDRDGRTHPMVGALPLAGRFGPRLVLGYRDAVAVSPSVSFAAGQRCSGHEFHRSVVEEADSDDAPAAAWGWRTSDGAPATEGAVSGSIHASFLHTHPAGQPDSVVRFVDAARTWRGVERVVAG